MAIKGRSALESLQLYGLANDGPTNHNTGGIGAKALPSVTTADRYQPTPKPVKKAKKPFGARQDSVGKEPEEVTPDSPLVSKVLGLVPLLDDASLEAVLFLIVERLRIQSNKAIPERNQAIPEFQTIPEKTIPERDAIPENIPESLTAKERYKRDNAERIRELDRKRKADAKAKKQLEQANSERTMSSGWRQE